MNYSNERQYIEAHFFTNWDADTTPVKFDNTAYLTTNTAGTIDTETGLDEWCRLSIQPASGTQADMNSSPRTRVVGVVSVNCFVKAGTGTARIRQLIDNAIAVFALKTQNGITFRAGNVSNQGEIDGFYQMTVTFDYLWDTV